MTAALYAIGHAALIVWLLIGSTRRSIAMIATAPVLWFLLITTTVLMA